MKKKDIIITPYEKNAKEHPAKQIELIARSIARFGWQQPIKVGKDGVIIAGHGRFMAYKQYAEKLSLKPMWVIDESGREISGAPEPRLLTEREERAYRLADNQINALSGNDKGLVLEELRALESDLVELTGFSTDLILHAEEIDDVVPQTPKKPLSKYGDLYELGEHRILCGDSTDIDQIATLMQSKKADMIFTDPPYGVDYDGGHANKIRREKIENDDITDMYKLSLPLIYEFSTQSAPLYIWFADRFAKDVIIALEKSNYSIRSWIIWNKNLAQFGAIGAQYKSKHEPLIYAFKNGYTPSWIGPKNETTVWDINRSQKNDFHPTQKPVDLSVRAILNHINTNSIILDLFLGSGSTLIAAQKTGRICYGVEIDPKYVDVIIERYVQYTGDSNIIKNGKKIVWKQK